MRCRANEAKIAALQDRGEHAHDRADIADGRADTDRDRSRVLEGRINLDAMLIAELQADGLSSPVGDRHWARRNLVGVPAAPGTPALVPLTVANPFPGAGASFLQLRPTEFDQARLVPGARDESGRCVGDVRLLDLDGALVAKEGRDVGLAMD